MQDALGASPCSTPCTGYSLPYTAKVYILHDSNDPDFVINESDITYYYWALDHKGELSCCDSALGMPNIHIALLSDVRLCFAGSQSQLCCNFLFWLLSSIGLGSW